MSGNTQAQVSKADAFLVSCIDPRLTDDTTFLQAALGRTDRYSEMRIAGAALAAVDSARPAWGTALWENLQASISLHGIRKVTFVNHRDCGAMNAWAGRRLQEDPAEELRIHGDVLREAATRVRQRHPDLLVEIKLMELDGSARVLPCPACVPTGFRAEAVGPASRIIAGASLGSGALIPAPQILSTPPDADGFAQLVQARSSRGGPLDASRELELLSQGVTRYGLSAREVMQVRERVAQKTGQPISGHPEREVEAYLRTRADAQGRIGRQDVRTAGNLYRRLVGVGVTAAEAEGHAARIAEKEGLRAQPAGMWPFRSTRWLADMSARAPLSAPAVRR